MTKNEFKTNSDSTTVFIVVAEIKINIYDCHFQTFIVCKSDSGEYRKWYFPSI